jgi:MFS family permease
MAEEVTTLSIAAALRSDRIVAPPGWSRWLIPPAALSIGSVYSWSVFKLPLQKTLGVSGVVSALPFTFGIVMLGLAAAVFGTTVERRGPRRAMAVSATCFCSGLVISALAAAAGQMWLVVVGYGIVGGIGLGIGYISPVSPTTRSPPESWDPTVTSCHSRSWSGCYWWRSSATN